jgi:O-antigen ligase
VFASDYWFRIENAIAVFEGNVDADGSTSDRVWRIQRGLEIWGGNPILGIGLANYASVSQADHVFSEAIGGYSHNNYIEILVGTGLVGFLLYLSIYVFWAYKLYTLRHALRQERTFAPYVFILAVVVITIATDLTRASYFEKVFWLLFPLVAAGLYLLESKNVNATVDAQARNRTRKAA